jgi:hypothetical protein
MFNRPVSMVKTTKLNATNATKAVSPEVMAKQLNGRHTISLAASGSTVYVGGADVTKDNGMPLAAGQVLTIPVASDRTDQVYVIGGTVILTEWF